MLFFFLYFSIVNERVQREMDSLLSRGMSHRNVLEKNFDLVTINHVAFMESEAETMVVITDEQFDVIKSSNKLDLDKRQLLLKTDKIDFSNSGTVLESRWRTEPYLASVSPVQINDKIEGYVYMFSETGPIRQMIQSLTMQFIIVGGIALVISSITVFFLSRFITIPLIQMKKMTEKLSSGKNKVVLDTFREDELGELAKSIQKLSNDLERMKQERSEFLSSISHELRTPLTYLKGYADILTRPNLSKTEHEEYVAIIQEETTNLTMLVKDLFDLAKMDQHQFSIQKQHVQLCDFLKEVVLKFKAAFEAKNMLLQVSCDNDIMVWIDPIRLGQVMNNLLDNALKYSDTHTNVLISVKKQDEWVVIKVTDQGLGIPNDEVAKIWDRLYRVDKSRSRATGGSGLGLSIAKEIIELHGGIIEVDSKLGQGTTFTIHLQGGEPR